MTTFFYLGLIFFVAIIIGAQLLRVPPIGFCPAGWTPPTHQASFDRIIKTDFSTKEMIMTRRFWLLWFTYFIGCTAGLLVIMNLVNIWQALSSLKFSGAIGIIPRDIFTSIVAGGAVAVMIVSIFNGLGRIVWGRISDAFGREKTLAAIFLICAAALLALNYLTLLWMFVSGVALIGFCFGGFLALYPAITADYFGTKNIGANYGLMFSAYGAGGLLGPWLAPRLLAKLQSVPYEATDSAGKVVVRLFETGSYETSFCIAGILCLLASYLIFKIRPANKQKNA